MRCCACGGSRIDLPARPTASDRGARAFEVGSSRVRVGRLVLAVCETCGLAWQHPLPDPMALEASYAGLRDDVYVEETDARRVSARKMLRVLGGYATPAAGPLLDVGCSVGIFLEEARAVGWDVCGIEPSAWLARIAEARVRARILATTLERADLGASRFAVVTMWDVLEHVLDPPAFLARARALLRPGGILALNVPSRDSIIARVLGRRWPLLLPEHVYYFTRPALRALLRDRFRLLGFHAHPVHFSSGYVLHRLSQHGFPGAAAGAGAIRRWLGRGPTLPLLMGEVTVFAARAS